MEILMITEKQSMLIITMIMTVSTTTMIVMATDIQHDLMLLYRF